MSRRDEWQKVLDFEVKRWSAMSCGQLVSELPEVQTYEVELDSKQYQVEVELLENTLKYVHVFAGLISARTAQGWFPPHNKRIWSRVFGA